MNNPIWHRFLLLGLLTTATLVFTACPDDEPDPPASTYNVNLIFKAVVNGSIYNPSDIYAHTNGQNFSVEAFRLYVSRMAMVAPDGTEQSLGDVALLDLKDPDTIKAKIAIGTYNTLKFGLGLDAELNNTDPTAVPKDSPLYFENTILYWAWLKYTFLEIIGKADPQLDPPPLNTGFAYHCGTDPLYKPVSLPRPLTLLAGDVKNVTVTIDLGKVFSGSAGTIDLIQNNVTHSNPDDIFIAQLLMDNLANAIF
ncbi:MAG: hypothetical protein IPN25_13575 [Sphingobacteriales bacterium]|nr:hypothetical protein [Sphingobacteriales bacterium]